MNNKQLYETIMLNVSKNVKKILNEANNISTKGLNDKFISLFEKILNLNIVVPKIINDKRYNSYAVKKCAPYIIEINCSKCIEEVFGSANIAKDDDHVDFMSNALNMEIKAYNHKINNTITLTLKKKHLHYLLIMQ